ncbi:SMI1/KNR4 family protein [Nonomuraea sp. NPDC003754]
MVFGPFRPCEVAEVELLEQEIGLSLPEAYRRFLEAAGGSQLEYALDFPVDEPDSEVLGFAELYQLGRDEDGDYGHGTLLGEYRNTSNWWPAPEIPLHGLLPIARNGGSDTLFLDLNPATHGQIDAFVHGLPGWTGRRQRGLFAKVADDFDAYLDSLRIDPDMAESTWGDVADADPADPWRRTVEAWLDNGLPDWRGQAWAGD